MTQHTPGPWRASSNAITSRDGKIVAATRHDMREANARLIAAAPKMLEALQALVRASDGHPRSVRERDCARAAIKEATGE